MNFKWVDNDKVFETLKEFSSTIAAEYDFSTKKPYMKSRKIKRYFSRRHNGGPPCRGFSLTGPRKFNDPRTLYISFINLVDTLRPKAF